MEREWSGLAKDCRWEERGLLRWLRADIFPVTTVSGWGPLALNINVAATPACSFPCVCAELAWLCPPPKRTCRHTWLLMLVASRAFTSQRAEGVFSTVPRISQFCRARQLRNLLAPLSDRWILPAHLSCPRPPSPWMVGTRIRRALAKPSKWASPHEHDNETDSKEHGANLKSRSVCFDTHGPRAK